jgi:P2 family phage contractile tail tube protein
MPAPRDQYKNFSVVFDGRTYVGQCSAVTLPTLAETVEDVRAGGMDAPLGVRTGIEKLTLSWKMIAHDAELMKLFGGERKPFAVLYALESYDGTVTAVRLDCRGRISSVETDELSAGAAVMQTFSAELSAYKHTRGGVVLVDIDVEQFKHVVGGVDRLAAQRAALGL